MNRASDIVAAVKRSTADAIEGWLIQSTPLTSRGERKEILRALQQEKMPAIFTTRQWVTLGGLASYGTNRAAQYHQAAGLVDKILKGAKPADLPVERPAKFKLVINVKTAKELEINLPPPILLRADEVIE